MKSCSGTYTWLFERGNNRLAEELRKHVSIVSLPEVGYVTASFGVTSYRSSDTIDTILLRADNMLYEAKGAGRNCVKSE